MDLNEKMSKFGIIICREFTQEEVRYVAENVTIKLTNAFPILNSQYNEIFAQLLNCKMYFAKINQSSNLSTVNYMYEDHSIIFNQNINIKNINDKIIHECIHFIQDVRTSNDKINKIGLFQLNELSLNGLGINEASDQYIASKANGNSVDIVNVYDIILKTISPNYYPLITNLVYQIMFLLGEDIVVEGTICKKSNFEDIFLNTFEEKANIIKKKFDKIILLNNDIVAEKNDIFINQSKINKIKEQIKEEYFETQSLIMTTYFSKMLNQINTIDEVKSNVDKLQRYGYWMGIDKNNFNTEYEAFEQQMLQKFDEKLIEIYRKNSRNTLLKISNNRFIQFLKRIVRLYKEKSYEK